MWDFIGTTDVQGSRNAKATEASFEINPTTIDGITYKYASARLYAYPEFLIPFHQTLREIQRNNPDRDLYGEMAWSRNPQYRDLGPLEEFPLPIAWNQGTSKRIDGSDEPDQFVILPFYRWEVYLYDNKGNRLLIGSGYFEEQNRWNLDAGVEYHSPTDFQGDPLNQNELAELSRKATLQYNQSIDTFHIINWNRILNTHQSLFKNLK
tara:strand:+ start:3034 stop:3657 length:624 start_codon:yes stop_codon:yes gene_type:complete